MSTPLTYFDALKQALVQSTINELHSQIHAVITSVDYDKCLVSAQPLVRDGRSQDRLQKYPEIQEIPIAVYSSAGNTARVTLPIKEGDVGAIHFSEQESSSFINGNGSTVTDPEEYTQMGLYPLYFTIGVSPISLAKKIDPDNIVIENESTYIEIEPSGKVNVSATQLIVNASQSITMSAPICTINAKTTVNGTTTFNGDSTTNGNQTTSGNNTVGGITSTAGFTCAGTVGGTPTINGPVNITGDATIGGISYAGHTHTEQGDGAETSTPN